MVERVTSVQCELTIKLSNATTIPLKLDVFGEQHNLVNYITNISKNESSSAQGVNPVGVVSSDTLTIELKSVDRSLIPENEASPYFGFMDNTAIILIKLIDEIGDITFGKMYVSQWSPQVTSSNPYRVVIECTDILSIIGKSSVPSINMPEGMLTKDYFLAVIDAVNLKNDSDHQLNYTASDISFSEFPEMQFSGIDLTNMSDLFNIISQSTLTNIYIGRDNKLKTDYCCNDTASESVCTLSDNVNLLNISPTTGGLVGFNGVKVNYNIGVINPISKVVELTNQQLVIGENSFTNIDLGGNVFKINIIEIVADDGSEPVITLVEYSKNNLKILLTSVTSTTCSIYIYGQTVNNSQMFIEKYKDTINNNSVLTLTNTMIPASYIDKFCTEMVSLLGKKNSRLTVAGWINPRILVGDTVYIDAAASTKLTGYYKVITATWNIAAGIKGSLQLMKLIGE